MHLKGKIGPCISYTTRLPATIKSSDVLLAYEQDDFNVFSLIDVHVYGKYPPCFINTLKKEGVMFFDMLDEDELLLSDAKPNLLL